MQLLQKVAVNYVPSDLIINHAKGHIIRNHDFLKSRTNSTFMFNQISLLYICVLKKILWRNMHFTESNVQMNINPMVFSIT